MVIPLFFSGSGGTSSEEVTATRDQVLKGYTAVTNDSDDEPIEGTIVSEEGKTVYATSSDQVINGGIYISSDLVLKGLSQTNLDANNILRGKTVTISNGLDNVWSITGNSIGTLKYAYGTMNITSATGNYARWYPSVGSDTTPSTDVNYYSFNSGITPIYMYCYPYSSGGYIYLNNGNGYMYGRGCGPSYYYYVGYTQTAHETRLFFMSGGNVTYFIAGY